MRLSLLSTCCFGIVVAQVLVMHTVVANAGVVKYLPWMRLSWLPRLVGYCVVHVMDMCTFAVLATIANVVVIDVTVVRF